MDNPSRTLQSLTCLSAGLFLISLYMAFFCAPAILAGFSTAVVLFKSRLPIAMIASILKHAVTADVTTNLPLFVCPVVAHGSARRSMLKYQ